MKLLTVTKILHLYVYKYQKNQQYEVI